MAAKPWTPCPPRGTPARRRAAETTDARGASTTSHADIRWFTAVARGRAHMTVLRREDVQSRVASWDEGPCRIASSPILAIVPLIIRRLRGPSPARGVIFPHPSRSVPLVHDRRRACKAAHQKTRQLARDRHGDLRRRLVFGRQLRKRRHSRCCALSAIANHPSRLPFPTAASATPTAAGVDNAGGFHKSRRTKVFPVRRDSAAAMLFTTGVSPGHESEIGHEALAATETGESPCSSAKIKMPSRCTMPRKQRNHATGSRYGLLCAISVSRASSSMSRASTDRAEQIVLDHHALRLAVPTRGCRSMAVRLRPVAAAVMQAAAQEQFAEPMPTPLQIFPRVIARAHTGREPPPLSSVGGRTFRQQPRAQQLHSLRHRGDLSSLARPVCSGTNAGGASPGC